MGKDRREIAGSMASRKGNPMALGNLLGNCERRLKTGLKPSFLPPLPKVGTSSRTRGEGKGSRIEVHFIGMNLGKKVTRLATLKAIASSGGIAAWAIWREYAFVWGLIIAASQLADALKEVFPFTKTHKAASDHAITLTGMFIDAQLEWENIFSGRYTDEQIMNRRHKLKRLQHETERKNFPHGLAEKEAFVAEAEQEAVDYFASMYGVKITLGTSDG